MIFAQLLNSISHNMIKEPRLKGNSETAKAGDNSLSQGK